MCPPPSDLDDLLGGRTSRRRFLAGSLGVATAAALAACGDSDDGGGGRGAGGDFPVTVKHRYGRTTIEKPPKRVVSHGITDHDTIMALGAVPVGIVQWVPEWRRGVGPWGARALRSARPKLFKNNNQVQLEEVAELQPDLISAVNFDLKEDDYDKLSQIAPTVGPVPGYPVYGTPWDVVAVQIGTALGQPVRVKRLVGRAKARFAAARRELAEYGDEQVMIVAPGPSGQLYILADTDTRGRFVKELGFRQSKQVSKLTGDRFFTTISQERFDLLDGAALIVMAEGLSPTNAALESEAFRRLDVVRRGSAVMVRDMNLSLAISASTVSSVPYALPRIVPRLERALAA
jgi:iron complex transport system substrate-binding protein